MTEKIDLTAVVTMHNEGVIAHKTMRSVFEALRKAKEAGFSSEIIVHIDNGDEETKEYVSRYKQDKNILIYENHFGDLGSSRNFTVEKAHGKYVAFLDGDDLVSDNWYVEALKLLENSKDEIVVHPEAILTFGVEQPNVLTLQKDSFSKERDTMILLGENRWGSVVMARKETFEKNPYHVLAKGYCYEDYIFNIETTEKEIKHIIARETILFYRRSDTSMLSTNNQNNATIPYVSLFDFDKVRKIKEKAEVSKKKSLKDTGYKVYKKIRGNGFLNYFITPVAKATLKVLEHTSPRSTKKKIPEFVYEGWIKINHIESQLYPSRKIVEGVSFYSAENQSAVGDCYRKIAEHVTKKPDYIFIVPWVVRGGADKVLFNYIKAMKEIRPEWNFMVISIIAEKNIWADNLPEYVDYVDFGKYASGLPPVLQSLLLTRVITQTQCKNIHIINSEYGYIWAKKHKDLIRSGYNLSVSFFAYEYIPGSDMRATFGFDNPRIFEIYDVIDNVFTDNKAIIDYSMDANGFNENKFKVIYQPVDYKKIPIKDSVCEEGKINVLWAGRIATAKLPDVVVKIGKKLGKDVNIHIYGELGRDVQAEIFDNLPSNVKCCGAYDGFGSLPVDKMDLFLYTSLMDGMPNAVLEAAAAGLPIIASNDGGVGEFVKDKETGILIENKLDVDEYVRAIEWAKKNMDEMRKYAKNAQKLLTKQHSWEKFVETVKKDFKL